MEKIIKKTFIEAEIYKGVLHFFIRRGFKKKYPKRKKATFYLYFEGGYYEFTAGVIADYAPLCYKVGFNTIISLDYINEICNKAMKLTKHGFPEFDYTIGLTGKYSKIARNYIEIDSLKSLKTGVEDIYEFLALYGMSFFDTYSSLENIDKEIQNNDFTSSSRDMNFYLMGDKITKVVMALVISKICRPQDFEEDLKKYSERIKDYDFYRERFDDALEYLSKNELNMPKINPPKLANAKHSVWIKKGL